MRSHKNVSKIQEGLPSGKELGLDLEGPGYILIQPNRKQAMIYPYKPKGGYKKQYA
jgi:hypothetical protein